jgi:hypothetical protein
MSWKVPLSVIDWPSRPLFVEPGTNRASMIGGELPVAGTTVSQPFKKVME